PPEEGVRKVLEVTGLSVDVASTSSQSLNATCQASEVPLLSAVSLTSRIAITPPCAALAQPQCACLSLRLLPLALSASPSHLAALLSAAHSCRQAWGGGAGAQEEGAEGAGEAVGGGVEVKEKGTEEGGGHDEGRGDSGDAMGGTREAAENLLVSASEEGEKAAKERAGGMMDGRQQEGQQGGQQGGQQKRGLFHSMGRAIGWVQRLFQDDEDDEASSGGAAVAATGQSALSVRAAAAAAAAGGRLENEEIWEWATGYEAGVHFDVAATDWSVAALLESTDLSLVSSVGGGMDGSGGASVCCEGDAVGLSAEECHGAPAPPNLDTDLASPTCHPKLECRLGAVLVEAEGRGRAVQAASVKVGPVAVAVAVPGSSTSGASLGASSGANTHVPLGGSDPAAVIPSSLRPLLRLHSRQQAGEAGAAAVGGRGEGAVGSYGSLQAPLLHSLAPLAAVLPAHTAAAAGGERRVGAGGAGRRGAAGVGGGHGGGKRGEEDEGVGECEKGWSVEGVWWRGVRMVEAFEASQAAGPLGLTADISLSLHVGLVAVSYWPGMCSSVLRWWQDVRACGGGGGAGDVGGAVRGEGRVGQEEPSARPAACPPPLAPSPSSPGRDRWLQWVVRVSSSEVGVDGVCVQVGGGCVRGSCSLEQTAVQGQTQEQQEQHAEGEAGQTGKANTAERGSTGWSGQASEGEGEGEVEGVSVSTGRVAVWKRPARWVGEDGRACEGSRARVALVVQAHMHSLEHGQLCSSTLLHPASLRIDCTWAAAGPPSSHASLPPPALADPLGLAGVAAAAPPTGFPALAVPLPHCNASVMGEGGEAAVEATLDAVSLHVSRTHAAALLAMAAAALTDVSCSGGGAAAATASTAEAQGASAAGSSAREQAGTAMPAMPAMPASKLQGLAKHARVLEAAADVMSTWSHVASLSSSAAEPPNDSPWCCQHVQQQVGSLCHVRACSVVLAVGWHSGRSQPASPTQQETWLQQAVLRGQAHGGQAHGGHTWLKVSVDSLSVEALHAVSLSLQPSPPASAALSASLHSSTGPRPPMRPATLPPATHAAAAQHGHSGTSAAASGADVTLHLGDVMLVVWADPLVHLHGLMAAGSVVRAQEGEVESGSGRWDGEGRGEAGAHGERGAGRRGGGGHGGGGGGEAAGGGVGPAARVTVGVGVVQAAVQRGSVSVVAGPFRAQRGHSSGSTHSGGGCSGGQGGGVGARGKGMGGHGVWVAVGRAGVRGVSVCVNEGRGGSTAGGMVARRGEGGGEESPLLCVQRVWVDLGTACLPCSPAPTPLTTMEESDGAAGSTQADTWLRAIGSEGLGALVQVEGVTVTGGNAGPCEQAVQQQQQRWQPEKGRWQCSEHTGGPCDESPCDLDLL
ncbi:unnamed protein product, partial [Closterium sp. NIES-53]